MTYCFCFINVVDGIPFLLYGFILRSKKKKKVAFEWRGGGIKQFVSNITDYNSVFVLDMFHFMFCFFQSFTGI